MRNSFKNLKKNTVIIAVILLVGLVIYFAFSSIESKKSASLITEEYKNYKIY